MDFVCNGDCGNGVAPWEICTTNIDLKESPYLLLLRGQRSNRNSLQLAETRVRAKIAIYAEG